MNKKKKLDMLPLILLFAVVCSAWDVRSFLGDLTPYAYSYVDKPYTPPEGCSLISYDLVSRHGSRYPTPPRTKNCLDFGALLQKYRDSLTSQWLRDWRCPVSLDDAGLLAHRGVYELSAIGSRAAKRFARALLPYNPNNVSITSSFVSRTSQSAAVYGRSVIGVWADTVPLAVMSESFAYDYALRCYDLCPAYTQESLENPAAAKQSELYLRMVELDIAKRVSSKTGLPLDVVIENLVDKIWDACRTEAMLFDDISHICSLFAQTDAEELEFVADLLSWWRRGYGVEIDTLVAAPLLVDVVRGMDASAAGYAKGESYVRSRLRFTHAETLLPFMSMLGLFQDEMPLLANMTKAQIAARKWRVSMISPMSSSLAFALYQCTGQPEPAVELLHKEATVTLPSCGGQRLCPLSQFKKMYAAPLLLDWQSRCKKH